MITNRVRYLKKTRHIYFVFLCLIVIMYMFILYKYDPFHKYKIFTSPISKHINIRQKNAQTYTNAQILIVGTGLSGAVLAHLHAAVLNKTVLIVEKRNHVAGNCYDFTNDLGIRVCKYGAHLFRTNNDKVMRFISQFGTWIPYEHRVVGKVGKQLVPIPVNIVTVNKLANESIQTVDEMEQWLNMNKVAISDPKNAEEEAMARVGKLLYEKIFKHYTQKQWNKSPTELDKLITRKIPVIHDFDDRYFPNVKYQVLPENGYTDFIYRMLNHPNIKIKLNTDFLEERKKGTVFEKNYERVFFTGPIDHYYAQANLAKLEYRSIRFETEHWRNLSFYQTNSVVNYPSLDVGYTRIVEYKHFLGQNVSGTTIVKEYSTDKGDPYYPVINERNLKLYEKYRMLAREDEIKNEVHFVGRLANFKYYNMEEAIANAMTTFETMYTNEPYDDGKIYGGVTLDYVEDNFIKGKEKFSISIIINHCKESLEWVKKIFLPLCNTTRMSIHIYEKCGERWSHFIPNCDVEVMSLPNVGREGHTWLFHMLVKSFAFKDINLFLHAQSHLTSEQIFAMLHSTQEELKGIPHSLKTTLTNEKLINHYSSQFPTFLPLSGLDTFMSLSEEEHAKCICSLYTDLTGESKDCLSFYSHYGGEFIVTDILLRRTLARHRQWMHTMYNTLSSEYNPVEAHYLERLWTVIFRYPYLQR